MAKPLTSPNVIVERGNIRPTAPHCYLPHCKNAVPCPDHIPVNNGTQDPAKLAKIEAELAAKRAAKKAPDDAQLAALPQVKARDDRPPCVYTGCKDRAVTSLTLCPPASSWASSYSEWFLCSVHAAEIRGRKHQGEVLERTI